MSGQSDIVVSLTDHWVVVRMARNKRQRGDSMTENETQIIMGEDMELGPTIFYSDVFESHILRFCTLTSKMAISQTCKHGRGCVRTMAPVFDSPHYWHYAKYSMVPTKINCSPTLGLVSSEPYGGWVEHIVHVVMLDMDLYVRGERAREHNSVMAMTTFAVNAYCWPPVDDNEFQQFLSLKDKEWSFTTDLIMERSFFPRVGDFICPYPCMDSDREVLDNRDVGFCVRPRKHVCEASVWCPPGVPVSFVLQQFRGNKSYTTGTLVSGTRPPGPTAFRRMTLYSLLEVNERKTYAEHIKRFPVPDSVVAHLQSMHQPLASEWE